MLIFSWITKKSLNQKGVRHDIEEQNVDKYTVKLAQTEHYVRVRVEGPMLRVKAMALDGTVIDAFELKAKR
jgi:hypothetical protein